MALIDCPECNRKVSDSAEICPNCGFGIRLHVKKLDEIQKEAERKQREEDNKRIRDQKREEQKKKIDYYKAKIVNCKQKKTIVLRITVILVIVAICICSTLKTCIFRAVALTWPHP